MLLIRQTAQQHLGEDDEFEQQFNARLAALLEKALRIPLQNYIMNTVEEDSQTIGSVSTGGLPSLASIRQQSVAGSSCSFASRSSSAPGRTGSITSNVTTTSLSEQSGALDIAHVIAAPRVQPQAPTTSGPVPVGTGGYQEIHIYPQGVAPAPAGAARTIDYLEPSIASFPSRERSSSDVSSRWGTSATNQALEFTVCRSSMPITPIHNRKHTPRISPEVFNPGPPLLPSRLEQRDIRIVTDDGPGNQRQSQGEGRSVVRDGSFIKRTSSGASTPGARLVRSRSGGSNRSSSRRPMRQLSVDGSPASLQRQSSVASDSLPQAPRRRGSAGGNSTTRGAYSDDDEEEEHDSASSTFYRIPGSEIVPNICIDGEPQVYRPPPSFHRRFKKGGDQRPNRPLRRGSNGAALQVELEFEPNDE